MSAQHRKAHQRLKELYDEAEKATPEWDSSGKSKEWKQSVRAGLRRLLGKDNQHLEEFEAVRYSPSMWTSGTPDSVFHEAFLNGVRTARAIIRAAIQEYEDYEIASEGDTVASSGRSGDPGSRPTSWKIFLVHGRDEAVKHAVARFLGSLGFEVVILQEQASGGATIVEKFERNSDVAFVVVLLTPDDIGALNEPKPELQPRARQNVILELGYFTGKLGRTRVAAIVRGPLEIPSDFHGILYIPYQGDEWKIGLVRELKHAGFDVDANEAF